MFCPRQLFRVVNRCRPPRWLSTVQHDSANILHDPQSTPVHTVQHDSASTLHDPQSIPQPVAHTVQSIPATHIVQHDSSSVLGDTTVKPADPPPKRHPSHTKIAMQLLDAAKNKRYPQCFRMAAQMKNIGMKPDILIYNGLMAATAGEEQPLLAWAILDDMLLEGIQPTVTTFFHLLHAQRYASSRYLWRALETMKRLSIEPNAQIYTCIVHIFTQNRNLEMAMQYLFAMRSQNIVPELSAVQSVVLLAAENGYARLALDIVTEFEQISRRRVGDEIWTACLYSSANIFYMDGITQCWKIAVNELDIAPNEGVCMSVLNAAARLGVPDLATDVFRVLKLSGVAWKEYHFAALIEAFCRDNKLKQALITLYIMRSNGIPPLPGTLVIICDSIKDIESLDSAIAIIDDIHITKVGLDIDALRTIIQASVLLRDLQRAVGVYKSYPDYGWRPDLALFNILLDGCIDAKHRQLGDELLADMKKLKIKANEETYERIIKLCLTQEVYEDAFFYLEEMKAAGFVPPRTVYVALVEKCHAENDTRKDIALAEMRECGYERPNFQRVKAPEVTSQSTGMGLDFDALEYIKTGGMSGKPS